MSGKPRKPIYNSNLARPNGASTVIPTYPESGDQVASGYLPDRVIRAGQQAVQRSAEQNGQTGTTPIGRPESDDSVDNPAPDDAQDAD